MKQNEKVTKYETEFRRFNDLVVYFANFDKNSLNDEDFFEIVMLFEMCYSVKNLFFLAGHLMFNTTFLAFIRRYIEALAIYNLFNKEQVSVANYKIFRFSVLNEEIRGNDEAIIRKALGLEKNKNVNINNFVREESYPYLYSLLEGKYENSNVVKNGCPELYLVYNAIGNILHNAILNEANEFIVEKTFTTYILPTINDLKKRCKKSPLVTLNINKISTNYFDVLTKNTQKMYECYDDLIKQFEALNSNPYYESFLLTFLSELSFYTLNILSLYENKDYCSLLISMKPIIERISIINYLFELEKNDAQKRYEYLTDLSTTLISTTLKYDLLIDENKFHRAYEEYYKEKTNLNYYDFKNNVCSRASFLVYLEKKSYGDSVSYFIKHNSFFSKNKVKEIYERSIKFGHMTYMFSYYYNDDFKKDADLFIRFLTDYYFAILDKLKLNNINDLKKLSEELLANQKISMNNDLILKINDDIDKFKTEIMDVFNKNIKA